MSEPNTPATMDQVRRKSYGQTFWMLNSIEMFERLAYFGIRAVVPIYIMQATEPGGLHMTAIHKGWIYMWWAILQSWLPMFTGGIADRYGYKRVLVGAISANVVGYLIMAGFPSYHGFFAGVLLLATGTAFFKPALQGSLAQSMTKENSSMGWGIFYWVVNVGAVMAPVIATIILGKPHSADGWRNLFIASAIYTSFNLLLLLTFKDVPSGADKSKSLVEVFSETIENIWPFWLKGGVFHSFRGPAGITMVIAGVLIVIFKSDFWYAGVSLFLLGGCLAVWLQGGVFTWQLRLPAFLLIMSAFWMMMYQLWDLHPNFIEDWIDSSMVAAYAPAGWQEYGDRGLIRVPQQILLNLNAALIVLLVVPISYLVRKMRTLEAMLIGMAVATIGLLVAGLTGNGWVFLLGVVFFSLGEMLTGPKKNQYLALIAPPGKKGLYLGYVNIPIGIGVGIGSMIAGVLYANYGEKATLALKELAANPGLVARAAQSADWSDALHKLPKLLNIDRGAAFELARADMNGDAQSTADALRAAFAYDRGQIDNLAAFYLALHPEYQGKTLEGFVEIVKERTVELNDKADALGLQVDELLNDKTENAEGESDDPAGLPATKEILDDLVHVEALTKVVQGLSAPDTGDSQRLLAPYLHLLPKALDIKRPAVFDKLRMVINESLDESEKKDDREIVALLWERFGEDPEVLNDLALEYLAQATDRLAEAMAKWIFEGVQGDLDDRIKEIEERIGIDRTKSFVALSIARGAEDEDVDRALDALPDVFRDSQERVFTYLITRPHHRFLAVGKKNWANDKTLLREIIRGDAAAIEVVLGGIEKEGIVEGLVNMVKRIFGVDTEAGVVTEEGINYTKLAGKQDLIHKALDARDWTNSPRQAAMLLGLNPYEARALVSAEVNKSPLSTTQLLWDKYNPQYKVWIPFAVIGVMAAIALAIFGRMAKKWGDMNA